MSETVARGAATIGQLYFNEKSLLLAENIVVMEYELEKGVVQHTLRVLGVGACNRNQDYLCLSVKDQIVEGKDHCWSEIARSVMAEPMLQATLPSVPDEESVISSSEESEGECFAVHHVQSGGYPMTMHATLIPAARARATARTQGLTVAPPVKASDAASPKPVPAASASTPKSMPSVSTTTPSQPTASAVPTTNSSLTANTAPTTKPPPIPRATLRTTPVTPPKTIRTSKPTAQPQETDARDYLDYRETLYTHFNDTGTGRFTVFDTLTKKMRGVAEYSNFTRNGVYEEYYDEKSTRPKLRGFFVNGEKHGDFITYYDKEKSPVESRVHYERGKRDGWYLKYDEFGQLRWAQSYQRGIEGTRIEFRVNGKVLRIVEREGGKGAVFIVEMRENDFIQYIGQARCEKTKTDYLYKYHGAGTLFMDFLACLHTKWVDGCATFEGKTVTAVECLGCVRHTNRTVVLPTRSGVHVPWEVLSLSGKDNVYVSVGGVKWMLREKKTVECNGKKGVETTCYGLFGYVLRKVVEVGNVRTTTEYYPIPGDGKGFNVGGITVHAYVKGLIEKPIVKQITVSQGKMVLSKEKYLNTGVKYA